MKAPKTLLSRTLKSFARTKPKVIVKRRKRKIGGALLAASEETAAPETAPKSKRNQGRPRITPPKGPPQAPHAEDHPSSKLSNGQRKRIIRQYDGGKTQVVLAQQFGVTQSAISHIVRNQRWLVETA